MSTQNQPRVSLSLFGTFKAARGDHPITFLRSKKSRALLAYLVLAQSKPILRDTLATLLWPGFTQSSARTNLRQALVPLRKLFTPPDLLKTNYGQVQLVVDSANLRCDVLQFDALLAACEAHEHISLVHCLACQDRLQQAAALYAGPFLDEFPDLDSAPFAAWRQTQQQTYAMRYAEIQALLDAGGQAEIGSTPGILPTPLTPLIGRATEVAELTTLLLHSTYRCLTLTGIGGSGKTQLALALGHAVRSNFADGTWWVDLSGLAPVSANREDAAWRQQLHDQIATTISSAMGLSQPGTLRPTEHLINHLRACASLLILDNYEQISAGAGLVAELLHAAPRLWLLITSRHRLPLQYQQVYHVEGLQWPPEEITVANGVETPLQGANQSAEVASAEQLLARYSSIELFVECARRADYMLPLDTLNLGALAEICRVVEGLPLAIELAATLLEEQTPQAILETLRHTYSNLQVHVYDMPRRQQSMHSVLVAAWQLLSSSEAQTLGRCSVFRGGFTLDSAQQVAGATATELEGLIAKSLLRRTEVDAPAPSVPTAHIRYTIHELVRQFAAEQLAQQAEVAKETGDRHAAYYMTLLAGWQPDGEAERIFRATLQPEIENVEGAWDWALGGDLITHLLPAVDGLVEFYEMNGRYYAVAAILRRSVAQVRARQVHEAPLGLSSKLATLLATLLMKLGHIYTIGLAQLEEADAAANEALLLAQELHDVRLTVHCYCVLATNAYGKNAYTHAQELAEKALALAQRYGLIRERMIALSTLGLTISDLSNDSLSLDYLHQALALAQQANDTRKILFYRNQLGGAYRDLGDFSAALRCFEENLPATRASNDPSQLAFAVANLGFLMLLVGHYGPAQTYLEDGYQRFVVLGEKRAASDTLALIGQLLLQQGRYESTITYCRRALALAEQNDLLTAQQMAWLTLGDLYREQEEWDDADRAYANTAALCEQPDAADILLLAKSGQAAVLLGKGDPIAALAALERLLPKFEPNDFHVYFPAQRFLLPAYSILYANNDPRATDRLRQAWQIIRGYAGKISDPRLRHSYLKNIPLHHTIEALVIRHGLAIENV